MSRRLPSELRYLILFYLPIKVVQRINDATILKQYLTNNDHVVKTFYNWYILPNLTEIPETLTLDERLRAQKWITNCFNLFTGDRDTIFDPELSYDRWDKGLILSPSQGFTKIAATAGLVGYQAQLFIPIHIALIYAIRQQDEELVLHYLFKPSIRATHWPLIRNEALLTQNKHIFALVIAYDADYTYLQDDLSDLDPKFAEFVRTHFKPNVSDYPPENIGGRLIESLDLNEIKTYISTREFPAFGKISIHKTIDLRTLAKINQLYE